MTPDGEHEGGQRAVLQADAEVCVQEFLLLVITKEQMYIWAENKPKRTELWFRLKRLIFTCRLLPSLPIDR